MVRSLRKPTAKVGIITEIQYYSDGSSAVIKSCSMPLGDKVTKKKAKKDFSGECTGGVEL